MTASSLRGARRRFPLLALCAGAFAYSACQRSAAEAPSTSQQPTVPEGWEMVWHDEFDGSGLPDPSHWSYDVGGHGWGNNELQSYTEARAENARIKDGHLIIEARHEAYEGAEYTSARLTTKGHGEWTHGRFVIRARLPEGRGTWPAIWMLPVEWTTGDGGWPDVGELDIMEHVGHNLGVIHASAHSRDYQWQVGTQKTGTIEIPDATTAFHDYILEWTPDVIRAFVDDRLYFEYENEGLGWSKWPYTQDFYLILNIAVGGAWGGEQGVDPDVFPQRMEVDYVRVYQQSKTER